MQIDELEPEDAVFVDAVLQMSEGKTELAVFRALAAVLVAGFVQFPSFEKMDRAARMIVVRDFCGCLEHAVAKRTGMTQ